MSRRNRSVESSVRSHARFVNCTRFDVRVFWHNFAGAKQLYGGNLKPGEGLNVDTYVTHPWTFENTDGDLLSAEGEPVFFPRSWRQDVALMRRHLPELDENQPVRRLVLITCPLLTLEQCSLRAVRDALSSPDPGLITRLDLPKSLKTDLSLLIKRKLCASLHDPSCNCCETFPQSGS